ncbi:hypothetical protein [Saccharopolyspora endophytica]|uniref:Carbonic anhydrase n=1 Tax=Saccharopolyspora endophytica TaxID=543886 RepID=A0ABS5DKD2_9PSEU|nr:hypothetical protein [Saccharopolyspora endophytica]MBQ0926754.1 hypothetical protein [Saccharopolyspora endophytica]
MEYSKFCVLAARFQADEILADHVRNTVEKLLDRSTLLAERVESGQTAVVGLCYSLADGRAHVAAAHGGNVPVGTTT